ncbi:phenylacetate--CoA ligase family protein [Mycobacterium pyrenivorans]|nr:phenylacetate--CoA ligase family protein [Mycolicibacterium pyrenivorans]
MRAITTFVRVSWDALKAGREREAGIARRQSDRLQELVAFAREHSPYLARRYQSVPAHVTHIDQMPALTKAEMMAHFDEWITDPAVSRKKAEDFIADPNLIGHDLLDRYVVCTTSGATGTPAILLHDRRALTVYNVLGYVRSMRTVLSARQVWALLRGKGRMAAVFVTGGHYLGNTMIARRHQAMPWRAKTQRLFSALTPQDELVDELNAFSPVILGGYPSALDLLARQQLAGRLHIRPFFVSAAGETLTDEARQRISAAFGCRVSNYYGSSEAIGLTFECAAHRMHLNSDWYIVEPIDADGRPTPPGQMSDGVLITNLANRIQPIIRYQMGDRIAISPTPCPCGSPFPQISVEGRTGDVLVFPSAEGAAIRILPLPLVTVAEETPGLASCQLIQTAPSTMLVRLSVTRPQDEPAVWNALRTRLVDYLAAQGAGPVIIEKGSEGPQLHPRSGKFRQVYSEVVH